jgi:hypothetical protein
MMEENRHRCNDIKLKEPEDERFYILYQQSYKFLEDFFIDHVFLVPG